MLVVRCTDCNTEVSGHGNTTQSCGCPNMTTVKEDSVTAVDLSRGLVIQSGQKEKKTKDVLTTEDLKFQEQRRKRKVRKLDFEVR